MPLSKANAKPENDTKLLGVRIERDLHRKAREQAFREDRPLSDLVRDALQRYLAEVA